MAALVWHFPAGIVEVCFGAIVLPIALFALSPMIANGDLLAEKGLLEVESDGSGVTREASVEDSAQISFEKRRFTSRAAGWFALLLIAWQLFVLMVRYFSTEMFEAVMVVMFMCLGIAILFPKQRPTATARKQECFCDGVAKPGTPITAAQQCVRECTAELHTFHPESMSETLYPEAFSSAEGNTWCPNEFADVKHLSAVEQGTKQFFSALESDSVCNGADKDGKLCWGDLDDDDDDDFAKGLVARRRTYNTKVPVQQGVTQSSMSQTAHTKDVSAHTARRSHRRSKAHEPKVSLSVCGTAAVAGKASKYIVKIRELGRAGDLEGVLATVDEALESGQVKEWELLNALLFALVQCGDVAGSTAAELFYDMKVTNQADVASFNIMLRSYLKAGERDQANALLTDMSERGLTANKVTFNELLLDAVAADDLEKVWCIVDQIKAAGLGISKVTCSILLKSLTGSSPPGQAEKVVALLEELIDPVDEVLYTAAIEACIRVNEPRKALDILQALKKSEGGSGGSRSVASVATYGTMIRAHGQAHDLTQVWATWNEMLDSGVIPSAVALGCMVEALVVNAAVDDAWRLVHDILADQKQSMCVNTVIYSTVMKGFSHARQPERCFAVLEEMRIRGVKANAITYNTLLDACAKQGAMSRVPKVFEYMRASNVEPDMITYSTLIKGYCTAGDLDCAFALLAEMKQDGKLCLDEIVFNSLLDGCGRQQKVRKAMEVLSEMREAGVTPSNYTLSIMVKVLGRASRLNEAFALIEEFRAEYGLRANVQVYTCLLQACFKNKQVKRALKVHDTMVRELQRSPDAKAYNTLLDGCTRAGALKEGVQVARCAYRLPGHALARPNGCGESSVALDPTCIANLDSKIRSHWMGADVLKAWSEVLMVAGHRLDQMSTH